MRSLSSLARLGLAVLLCTPVSAFEGNYEVQGVGPEGSYQGSAQIESKPRGLLVQVKSFDSRGAERRLSAPALFRGKLARFTSRALIDTRRESALRVTVRPLEGERGSLIATYTGPDRKVLRREVWLRTATAQIPVQVVALSGDERFPGVGSAQARHAQKAILAQLNAVFHDLDVSFQAITSRPVTLPGAPFDADADGRLSTAESRALRDALEIQGAKRRGRVVVVVTASAFAHGKCRGWTLGDAPPSPRTLDDPNDNFSLVGLDYIDPTRFHTVAHEVAHQLGLDDLNPYNREALRAPHRDDHLMISGGTGIHVDPAASRLLRQASSQFPDHGLEGRLGAPRLGFVPRSLQGDSADGLPGAPKLKR